MKYLIWWIILVWSGCFYGFSIVCFLNNIGGNLHLIFASAQAIAFGFGLAMLVVNRFLID